MAPRTDDYPESSLPGFDKKYPTFRKQALKTADVWIEGKRADDNAEGLWRVHDGLYDFSQWIHKHPGGSDWLEITKGTDITEAFETHHIAKTAEYLLKQFFVRNATGPRYSPYTFEENGFYRTLKRKARPILAKLPPGPSKQSRLSSDLLLVTALLLATIAASTWNFSIGLVAGILLNFTVVTAHNFFHMKDNIRMYYFDLSFMASRDWRISHALSHHLFTNSVLDLELAIFEPLLQWVPHNKKSLLVRYASWIYTFIIYSMFFQGHVFIKLFMISKGKAKLISKIQDLIPYIPFLVMYTYSGATFINTFIMWCWVVCVSSFFFAFNGFNAAHHHPEIFHDGDAPRADQDWGIGQIDAVRDRVEIDNSRFLVLVLFGNHCLHHMFPTIDHWHLHHLYPVFNETCKEFGITYKTDTAYEMLKGQFLQLARINPNPVPPEKCNK